MNSASSPWRRRRRNRHAKLEQAIADAKADGARQATAATSHDNHTNSIR